MANSLHVLVVEDNQDLSELIKVSIEKEGIQCDIVSHGNDAISHLIENPLSYLEGSKCL